MARTQKNKATSGHLGLLKARLAKLRRELIEPKGGGGGGGEGFDVAKTGDARIGFVGKANLIPFNFLPEIQMFLMPFQIMYLICILVFWGGFCVHCQLKMCITCRNTFQNINVLPQKMLVYIFCMRKIFCNFIPHIL